MVQISSPQTENALKEEFSLKKRELMELRSKLQSLGKEKESSFHALQLLRKEIRENVGKLKTTKEQRDALSKNVQLLKEERGKLNAEVREKAHQQKEIAQKKKDLLHTLGEGSNVHYLKRQIQFLEKKIETEVMAFTKEKELTKKVKELSAQLKKATEVKQVYHDLKNVSSVFGDTRKRAEESHLGVQQKAQESQQKHEVLVGIAKELEGLRAQEKVLMEKCFQLKQEFEQARRNMDTLQKRLKELSALFHEEKEKSFHERVKEKTAEVTEKIKKGKKLSMDDILTFQASKEKE